MANKNLLKSKKSAEMTIGTIIIIVLALVVLVFLIFAFIRGTGGLNDYISNLFAGGSNIDTIKNSCSASCASSAMYAFCSEVRTVKTPEKTTIKGSCATLVILGKYGIDNCVSLTCNELPKKCSDLIKSGDLSESPCDTKTEENLFSQVGDSEGKDIRKANNCCNITSKP